eukprot:4036541-Ditylum_brightwellii.AAC.1
MVQAKEEDSDSNNIFAFTQAHVGIPKTWLLFDSESMVDMFSNASLLTNIREVDLYVTIYGNNNISTTNMMGLLRGYGNVKHKFCIIYDSSKSDTFEVYKSNEILLFHEYKNSLHYHGMANMPTKKEGEVQGIENNVTLLNNVIETVKGDKDKFLACQVEASSKARKLYAMVGFPFDCDFKNMVKRGMIKNCPVMVEDNENANKIFGADTATLKGKTV